MRNIKAVFTKQVLSYFKNEYMIGTPIAFLLIPLAILILIPGAMTYEAAAERMMIVGQFVIMFIGISTIGNAGAYIGEDRATMNLRFMGMAGVKPWQYLVATAAAMLMVSFIALILFGAMMGHFASGQIGTFLMLSMLAVLNSILLGITLGLSKLAPFTSIVGILLGVGPIFADANETLAAIFSNLYTYQVNAAIRGDLSYGLDVVLRVVFINMAVLVVAFVATNSRYGLDGERLRG